MGLKNDFLTLATPSLALAGRRKLKIIIFMNKYQQITLSIISPLIILLLGYGYIVTFIKNVWIIGEGYASPQWNDFEKTWIVWLVSIILIGVIELIIFSRKAGK
ncbi:MAG: hypothetical protein PHO91_00685 [Patescibacteria group bacterium]|nr:hypothetical protein [Patescibacteria group bacterium]